MNNEMKAYIHIASEGASWDNGVWAEIDIPAVPRIGDIVWIPDEAYKVLREKLFAQWGDKSGIRGDYYFDLMYEGSDGMKLYDAEMFNLLTLDIYKKSMRCLDDFGYVAYILYNCDKNCEKTPFGVHIFLTDHADKD